MNGKTISFSLIVITVVIMATLLFVRFGGGIQITYYETYDDVRKDFAIERGWIPYIIDEYTHHIIEQHNLDTNYQVVEFSFKSGYKPDIYGKLQRIERIDSQTYIPSGWDFVIDGNVDFYSFNGGADIGYLALNFKQSKGLYWSTGTRNVR